jgi:hypothetical protein
MSSMLTGSWSFLMGPFPKERAKAVHGEAATVFHSLDKSYIGTGAGMLAHQLER